MFRSMTIAVAAAALLVAGSAAAAPQSKSQQKCINTLNKAMAKVSGTQAKAVAKCVKTLAKTGAGDASMCASTDAKVDKIQDKTCPAETKACPDAPEFGSTSCNTVNGASEYHVLELGEDIFGSGVNAGVTTCSADKPGCKCQGKVLKSVAKLLKTSQKSYNKCKKGGLKSKTAPIADVAGLNACLLADAKNKIEKAETKLNGAITKSCAAVATPFGAGECMGQTGASLTSCLAQRVRCRHCLTAQVVDDLTIDCDDFDNDSDDLSCADDF